MRAVVIFIAALAIGAGGYFAFQQFAGAPDGSAEQAQDAGDGAARDVAEASGGEGGASEDVADRRETERPAPVALSPELSFIAGLQTDVPSAPLASESDYRALAEMLAPALTVEYGAFEAQGAGAEARDVTITLAGVAGVGYRIDALRIWGAEAGESFRAARLDARGLEGVGLAAFSQAFFDSYMNFFMGLATGAGEGANINFADLGAEITRFDLHADQIVYDDLEFRPFAAPELTVDEGDAPFEAALKAFAPMAAIVKMISAERMGMFGLSGEMGMVQIGQVTTTRYALDAAGAQGMNGGDLARSVLQGLSYTSRTQVPLDDGAPISVVMGGEVDMYTVEGVRLAGLYDHLSQGRLPPTSETDVMSLGVWTARGERGEMNGERFYSIGETVTDLSSFHWLIPTEVEVRVSDAVYELVGLLRYISSMAASAAGGDEATEAALAQLDASAEILEKHNLERLAGAYEMRAAWSPDTGALAARLNGAMTDFLALEFDADIATLDFASVEAIVPEDGAAFDGEAAAERVAGTFAFNGTGLRLEDLGGLDRAFALAVDFAALAAEDNPQAAGMAQLSPGELRQQMAMTSRMMGPMMAAGAPPAAAYFTALADFIESGGVLAADASPAVPVTAEMLEAVGASGDPVALIDLFGLTVTHQPPAE